MKPLRKIGVYLGARPGVDAAYMAGVKRLGEAMALRNYGLVYGGSRVGLMGAVADAVLANGGYVFGVIPKSLTEREIPHDGLTESIVCDTMAERKVIMQYLSDGFISAPGGFGTFDETFDILTLRQIGRHSKPYGLLNTQGFYDKLLDFLDVSMNAGFVRHEHRNMIHVHPSPDVLLSRMFPHD